jgi:hypothetical protein
MRLTQSDAGQMIVEHHAGYAFVFERRDEMGVDLIDHHWEGVGPAPDIDGIEQEARVFVEMSVQERH